MTATARVLIPGPLGLGAAPLGNLFGRVTEAEARACIDAAWAAGLRYFDTAPMYGTGLSEHRIGAALRDRARAEFVLSTKVGRLLQPDRAAPETQDGYVGGLPFRAVFDYSEQAAYRSIEDSLARLGLAQIDIAYIHDAAADTHGAGWESVFQAAMAGAARALTRLREGGVIRAWGLGVNSVAPCLRALEQADPDVFLLAGRYTLLDTEALTALFPACAARGVQVVVGGPYNSGVLAGGTTFNYAAAPPGIQARVARITAICQAHAVPLKAAALQFCAALDVVAAVIAGARSAAEVTENAALMRLPIDPGVWRALKDERLLPEAAPEPLPQGGKT